MLITGGKKKTAIYPCGQTSHRGGATKYIRAISPTPPTVILFCKRIVSTKENIV
jgi:hypothetical protein